MDEMSGSDGGQLDSQWMGLAMSLGKMETHVSQILANQITGQAATEALRVQMQVVITEQAVARQEHKTLKERVDDHDKIEAERRNDRKWTVVVPSLAGLVALLSSGAAVAVAWSQHHP